MKISVIIPVYNMEDKLERCLNSVLAQTFSDFELILVDDGSKDRSGAICDEYAKKDSRITVIHKDNEGVGATKNRGIKEAQGEYLNFIDSDDFVDGDYLETLASANKGNYDLIIAGLKFLTDNNFRVYGEVDYGEDILLSRSDYADKIPHLLDTEALNFHVAKLYKRSIVEQNGILFTDFKKTGADDTVFNFDFLACAESVCVVNKNVYNYINYSSSTSHRFDPNVYLRRKTLDGILKNKAERMDILTEEMKLVLDKRIILASVWSAESFAVSCKNYKEYKEAFFSVANDTRSVEAYNGVPNADEVVNGAKLFYSRKCWKFYHFARKTKQKIKARIYRVTPPFVKKLYGKLKEKKNSK